MGGAAQYISIADMIVFEEVEFDDEAVGAREVEGKKKEEFGDHRNVFFYKTTLGFSGPSSPGVRRPCPAAMTEAKPPTKTFRLLNLR